MSDFKHANDLHDPLHQQKTPHKAMTEESISETKKQSEPKHGTLADMTHKKVGGLGKQAPALVGGLGKQPPALVGGLGKQPPALVSGLGKQPPALVGRLGKQAPALVGGLGHKKSTIDTQIIPRPDITTLAKKYDQDALGLVNAVIMHYQEQIKRNGKLSKHLNMAATLKVLLRAHFGLQVKVMPYGAGFKLELLGKSRSSQAGAQLLAKAIGQAKVQRGQLLAQTYAGNKHQGNSHQHGSVKEVMKGKGADAFTQKKMSMVDRSNQKALTYKQEYLYVSKALQKYGIYLTGNGEYPVIGGMKGNARGEFDMKEFAKYASVSFDNKGLTLTKFRKIYRAANRLFKTQKALKNFQAMEGAAKSLKHIKSAVGKGEQMGKYGRELVDNLSAGLGQLFRKIIGYVGEQAANHPDKTIKQKVYSDFDQMLKGHQMPGLGHDLYLQKTTLAIDSENGKTITKYKPRYKPSKKYPGYYIYMAQATDKYPDENAEDTTFFKVGNNGQMIDLGQLNQQ